MFGKMENKHNELLMCHRAKFVQSVEVERLYPILQNSGVLSAQDTEEIARITTSHGKVEKLLDILPSKGNQAFKSLCLALETTYPHLLTVMFLGSNVGSSQSTASPYTSESEAESEHKSPRLVLPPTQQYCSHDLCEENVRLLKAESKLISDERDQIRRELDHYKRRVMQQQNSGSVGSVGSMDDPGMTPRHRHDSHSNRDYDRLKEECQKAKNDLETLNSLYLEISHKCTNYATVCERQTRELHSFKQECFDLKVEKGRAQQDIVDLKQLHNDDKRELSMLREMINHKGSSEVLNKMYDTALEKYESMKKSYDDLRRRYLDKEEELSRLRSKFDLVQHERDQVVKDSNDMKQKLKTMITNREELIRERERERDQYRAGKLKSDRQRDEVRKEMDNARKVLILAKKDLARVTLERNDAIEEYRRVMSERDVVHKEIEALQDELQAEKNARTKYDGVKNSSLNEIKSLKIEIAALMKSRDQAIKQKQELQEQCNETISDKAEVQKQRDDALNDFEKYRYERDVARKERTEAIDERDQILRECYNVKQRQQSASSNVEHLYKEVERLNKLLEKCKEELREANQDAAIAKQRRDWAFSERDKIVLERESVRKMCDKLRRQRDRAVSELGESLRDSDDVQRQRSDAMKELRVIKEKLQIQEEKQSRMSLTHLVAHHSRDSAIDADSTEWETETVELECQKEDVSDFGFEIGNAKENPQSPDDCSIYVSRVDKGSIADGRLRVNDCLMKVNDVDLTNVDPSFAIKAVKSGGGVLNMVIKRRRPSSGKALQSIHLNLTGRKDIGLSLEQGIFISRVAPNSVAAQGNLTVGDRVIYVNGSPIENKTASDVEKLLESTGDSIALSILRSPTTSTVSGNSMFDSLHDKDSDSTKSNLQYSSSHGEIMEEIKTQLQNVKNMCVQTDNGIVPTLQNGAYCEYLNHESHSSRALPAEPEVTVISRPKESPKYRDPPVFRVPPPPIESPDDDNKLPSLPQMKKHPSTRYKKAWPKEKESSGTWPKSRGAPELYEVKGGGVYISHRKSKERVTIANGYEWRRYIEIPTKDNIKGSGEIPPIPPDRISSLNHSSFNKHSRQSSTHSSDSASTIVADSITPKHTPTPSGASTITMTSNHLHAVPPQNNGNEYKHFPTLSTPDTTMDYSVVSASDINEDPRPKSAPLKRKENHPHTVRAEMIQKPTTLDIAKPNIYKPVVSPLVNSDSSLTVCRAEAKISPSPVYVNGTQIRTSPHSYPIETHATTTVVTFKDVPFFTAKSKNIERNDGPAIASKPPTPRFLNHSSSPRSSITPQDIDRKRRTSPCPETHSDGYISSPNTSRRELNQSLDFTRRSPIHSPLRNSPHSFEMRDGHQSLPYYSRIKIPSASRVSPGPHSSTGSIEQVSISDRSSPISPTIPEHSVPSTSSDGSLSRLSIHSTNSVPRQTGPRSREPRLIQINERTQEPLGFRIQESSHGGVFVMSATEGSLAETYGLAYGDQILEYNGINLRCATYGQAANILRLGGDSINILAQYNPKKMEDDTDSSCSSVNSTLTPTPQSTATNSPTTSHSQMDMSFMSETGTMTPPTPRASICSSARSHDQDMMSSGMSLCEPPRFVMLQKINRSLGFSIVGGNAVGIFVSDIQPDSVANVPDGLRTGDQILELNGTNLRTATAEQAALELQKPFDRVTILTQSNIPKFIKIKSVPCDAFYIKSQIDRVAEIDGELSIRKDNILFVDDTMFKGILGVWRAWTVDSVGHKRECGQLPSKFMLEQEIMRKRSINDGLAEDELRNASSRRGSASARRSFFRRKKHQRNNSKDSRELSSVDGTSGDSVPIQEDFIIPTYQRVERLDYKVKRPVLLIGAFVDPVIEKLVLESPNKFCRCIPEKRTSQEMDNRLNNSLVVNSRQKGSHYEYITAAAIKEICNKDCHCILDVCPSSIERLHRYHFYPIVIFMKHKSAKQIKEQKDPRFLTEKLTMKQAKEIFENTTRIENEYRHLFTAVVHGPSLARLCCRIKQVVDQEQAKILWVPTSKSL